MSHPGPTVSVMSTGDVELRACRFALDERQATIAALVEQGGDRAPAAAQGPAILGEALEAALVAPHSRSSSATPQRRKIVGPC